MSFCFIQCRHKFCMENMFIFWQHYQGEYCYFLLTLSTDSRDEIYCMYDHGLHIIKIVFMCEYHPVFEIFAILSVSEGGVTINEFVSKLSLHTLHFDESAHNNGKKRKIVGVLWNCDLSHGRYIGGASGSRSGLVTVSQSMLLMNG